MRRPRSRPQPPITAPDRLEILESLRYANLDAAFATAFATLVSGAFIVGFIQTLGGKDIWIGLVSAIPSLAGLVQIPGAIWGRRYPTYKRFVVPGAVLWRFLYLPLIILPFVPVPAALKLTLIAFTVLSASVATMVANPIYNDWLAEMVPPDSRGYFFAKRNAIASATGAGVGLVGAVVLDWFRDRNEDQLGFAVVFGVAMICAVLSFSMFMRCRDIPRQHVVRENLLSGIKAIANPFRDRQYRKVLTFLAIFTVGQVFAGNLFTAYSRESLHLDFKVIQGYAVTYAAGTVLSAKFWGFLSDKYGNKPMLTLAGTAIALNPIAWLATIPGQTTYNAILLMSSHVVMGAFWCGVALCQFNLMLATAKTEDRANYIGAGLAVTALLGGVAPLLGASMMTALRGSLDVATAYKCVFFAVMGLRVFSMFFLLPVKETGAASVRETLQSLRRVTPKGYKAMRSLSRTSDAEERAEAIRQVGSTGLALASDEIIRALHDPLPSVRRRAALAIARLQDPRAGEELIHQVEEHPDLLEEETIEALGILADPAAIPALTRSLDHPSPLIRRAAAKALSRVATPGDYEVSWALIGAASKEDDPDLRRAALQALRVMMAREAAQVFRSALHDPLPSVRIAAAEGVAELQIKEAAEDLRSTIGEFQDEATSEAAYALGVVGTEADIPLILEEAARSSSMITRRRCLLGVARVLGVEQSAYRLLLKQGMERDAAVNDLLSPHFRKHPRLREALAEYAQGNDQKAIEALTVESSEPTLVTLSKFSVPELFLVAVCAVSNQL